MTQVNTGFALIKRGVSLCWTSLCSTVSCGGIPANVIWSLPNRLGVAVVLVSSVCLFPCYGKLTPLTSFLTWSSWRGVDFIEVNTHLNYFSCRVHL